MWSVYLKTPKPVGDNTWLDENPPSTWCGPKVCSHLASALHLAHRYLLHWASQFTPADARRKQISQAHNITELVKIPYNVIEQLPASNLVLQNFFAHIAMELKDLLVMAFAGPSGHGKTEMARYMGDLLSVDITVVGCARVKGDVGLLGSRAGYRRLEEGSQLNNFLAQHNGKHAIVLLDEFDKTDSLLLVCD